MRNDPFMRTYSPRQEALARAAAQQQATTREAAAPRPASTAPPSELRAPYMVKREPYYRPVADEVELYEAAYSVRMPMMLKGPTGCGKTRFVEYMAWKLGRPLVTIACHEDMTAGDQPTFTEVGTGTLDFPAIFRAAEGGNVAAWIVEQDRCQRPSLDRA